MTDGPDSGPKRPRDGRTRRPAPGTDRRKAWARVAIVVLFTVAALFAARMIDVALATRRAERDERQLAAEVERLQREVSALQTAAVEARTDAGVERWAREERGWGREGDNPIVVAVTPFAPVAAAPTTTSEGPWSRFRRWISERFD